MYEVSIDQLAHEQIDALPPAVFEAWEELRTTLSVAPGNGRPLKPDVPDGVMAGQFGPQNAALAFYLVLERERRVAILEVQWFGRSDSPD